MFFCDKVEKGMKDLLENGQKTVKASEIAERGGITEKDGHSAGWRVGYSLAYGACDDFDAVGYEILSNDNGSNDYRLWWK